MTQKPDSNSKASIARPVRKQLKGATETVRLFLNVDDINRRPHMMALTRYVE